MQTQNEKSKCCNAIKRKWYVTQVFKEDVCSKNGLLNQVQQIIQKNFQI